MNVPCFLRDRHALLVFWIANCILIGLATSTKAQQSLPGQQIDAHLQSGEYPLAISAAKNLPTDRADAWLAKISHEQLAHSSQSAAFDSASLIQNDRTQSQVVTDLAGSIVNRPFNDGGKRGGITADDFDDLIDLVTGVIAPESWIDSGGLGTIEAFANGVYVDSSGTLRKLKRDSKSLSGIRSRLMSDSGNLQPLLPSELRKVSLNRLESEARLLAARGLALDDTMQNLAGLTEIKYVMVYPETGDIVIAGPAGPWKKDNQNRAVNIKTGKPALQLDDLVVCLRNAWERDGKFGCSINPRQANLAATQNFLATSKLKGTHWSKELQNVLGQQDIEVFGIDSRTHAAAILVEADYRMKLVGMGLEPSIPEVPSYLDRVRLNADGSAPPMDVARWWFTLNYEDVFADESNLLFSFTGAGVQVLSESELLSKNGQLIHTGQSHGHTRDFARDFTQHFEKLADRYPIYRELKNIFDLALVSNLIRQQKLAEQVDWDLTYFGPATDDQMSYPVRLGPVPEQVDSVMNKRILKSRRGSKTLKHTIVGVSGGVSYDADKVIAVDQLKKLDRYDSEKKLAESLPEVKHRVWWWD